MFTIKLYNEYNASGRSEKIRIFEAESFTILKDLENGDAEITLHQKNGDGDARYDIIGNPGPRDDFMPPVFQRAIIENSSGKTTEMVGAFGPERSHKPGMASAIKKFYSRPQEDGGWVKKVANRPIMIDS